MLSDSTCEHCSGEAEIGMSMCPVCALQLADGVLALRMHCIRECEEPVTEDIHKFPRGVVLSLLREGPPSREDPGATWNVMSVRQKDSQRGSA